jgi:SAM-dependent methyltransferase
VSVVEHDAILAVDQTVVALERLAAPLYPEDDDRFYGLEPLPLGQFFAGMEAVGQCMGRSFLDVGCGIGTKIHLARMLGWQNVAGIDRYALYVAKARRLCPWADIQVCDAATFARYDEFDVVYMYRPCIADDDERELEQLVTSRMRPGAVAFFAQGIAEGLGEPLAQDVWRV